MSEVKVRDKFWLFSSPAHDDDIFLLNRGCDERFAKRSRITPAEGAFMLDIPNVVMVSSQGRPVPFSEDAYGYMESFCNIKNVMWSITGSTGFRTGNEEEFICELSKKYPNIMGAFLDDLMGYGGVDKGEKFYMDEIAKMKEKLSNASKPIELWSTCYTKSVHKYSREMYKDIDGITVWNMQTDEIPNMDEDFSRYEDLLPDTRKMLGLYIYDYDQDRSVTLENMHFQCETGLKWLKEGRIEGMIFLTNCVMGIGLKSEYWLRDWIKKVGNENLR